MAKALSTIIGISLEFKVRSKSKLIGAFSIKAFTTKRAKQVQGSETCFQQVLDHAHKSWEFRCLPNTMCKRINAMSHGKICRIIYLTSLVMSMFGTIKLIGCIFDKSIRLVHGFQICTKKMSKTTKRNSITHKYRLCIFYSVACTIKV